MLSYGIGLDIGITSVGWATVALDEEDHPYGIIGMGSRVFNAAEDRKTGASLDAPRREARSTRRRLRRRRHRKERIRALLVREGVLTEEQLTHLFEGKLPDIYALRVRALDEAVSGPELARILIHLAQRRGFRSNRKSADPKEEGALLSAVSANQARMTEGGYRTVAELYCKDALFRAHRRNKGGAYLATVSRDMVEDEVRQIFAAQRQHGNAAASEALEAAYLEILLSQRSFDEGPGENSPYAGNQSGKMVGPCSLLEGELRAAKASYSFELFSLLQTINHIRIVTRRQSQPLTPEQRETVRTLAHKVPNLDYARIRKELGLNETQTFNTVSYGKDDDIAQAEKKNKLRCLTAYHQMRVAYERVAKGHFSDITAAQRNAIAETLSCHSTSKYIREPLREAGLSELDIDIAETLNFSKRGHISVKACEMLIPYLEQGMNYSDACAAAGHPLPDPEQAGEGVEKTQFLPALDSAARLSITSPVALRSISQAIKVVNAIIRERGCSPTFLNVELAREMAKDFQERNQIRKEYEQNERRNERIMERLRTEFRRSSPTGQDLVKFRLYEEQGGICPYSQKPIMSDRLFETGYAEVDHIVPYSISFDDGYRNKVLVLAEENRNKGNRLPLEYLSGQRREDYIVWVKNSVRDSRKRQRLLKEAVTEEDEARFKDRNLQDTQTASRFILNYIQEHLLFSPYASGKTRHVHAVNGSVTSYLRKRWGMKKVRANGDLHHAVDALVVVCTTEGMIRRVSEYAKGQETRYTRTETRQGVADWEDSRRSREFPLPWPCFRAELDARLSDDPANAVRGLGLPLSLAQEVPLRPIFVSRAPRRKVSGSAHEATIKSGKELEKGKLVWKVPLTKLKLDKAGEIQGYYRPEDDRLLYETLKARLQQYGGDAKSAFAEPFYKPKHDGTPGPLVRGVKLWQESTLNVPVEGSKGYAENGDMVRIDVFHAEGDGYYFVPIYVADTIKAELPNKASVANKKAADWKPMRDEDFLFSVYPNDLLKITHKKKLNLKPAQKDSTLLSRCEIKSALLYFTDANISTASINCCNHDNSYIVESLGIKTLASIEKYSVDVLGVCHPVRQEKRMGFSGKKG